MEPVVKNTFLTRLQSVQAELRAIMQLLPELCEAQNFYRHSNITPDVTIIESYKRVDCLFRLEAESEPTWDELKVSYVGSKDPEINDSEEHEDCTEY